MKDIGWVNIIAAIFVIVLFGCVFGWGFWLTWTIGPDIAAKQQAAKNVERDRKDATRRFEDAKAALEKAEDSDRDSLKRDFELRRTEFEAVNRKADELSEAVAALMERFSGKWHSWATLLAGFVGSVVAARYGQVLERQAILKSAVSTPRPTLMAVCSLFTDLTSWRTGLHSLYASAYFAFGLVAVVFSLWAPFCPEMITNLASISGALFLAMAKPVFA